MLRAHLALVLVAAALLAGCPPGNATGCEDDGQCKAGEVCGSAGTCVPGCRDDRGCASGVCVAGACEAGTRCSFTSDCALGQQCGPQGLCIAQCQADADCDGEAACAQGTCVPKAGCVVDGDCTGGERCGPAGTCSAPCADDAACGDGQVCANFLCVDAAGGELTGVVQLEGAVEHSGVAVTLRGPGSASAVTDLGGHYRFRGLKAGAYVVTVRADATAEGEVHREVSVPRTGAVSVEEVRLTPVGHIAGRVEFTQSGEPAPNVQVFATSGGTPAVTDATGAYLLEGVRVGTTKVVAFLQGHQTASSPELTVARGAKVDAPVLGLVPVGSVAIGFVTEPPREAHALRTYRYTAAATSSEGTVSYALAHGPSGMTVSTAGVVAWTPNARQLGEHLVSLQASAAGMTTYQTYVLTVTGPFTVAAPGAVRGVASAGAHAWVATATGVRRLSGTPLSFPAGTGERAGTAQLTWGNGAKITSATLAKGALDNVLGAFGTLAASWSSGQVTGVVPVDSATIASARIEGGVATAAQPLDVRVITAATPLFTGTISSVLDGRRRPTSITPVDSGIAADVTERTLTDSAGTYTAGALNGRCLISSSGSTFSIFANTATSITVSAGDLRTAFSVGTRYYVGDNGCGAVRFALRDDSRTFAYAYSQVVAVYLPGSYVGAFGVTSAAGTVVQFSAPLSSAGTLLQAGAEGTYLVGTYDYYAGASVPVTIEDSAAPFAAGWANVERVGIDGIGAGLVTSATTTTVTVQVPATKLLAVRAGLRWTRVDGNGRATVRLALDGVAPGLTAGGTALIDDVGLFSVAAVSDATAEVLVPWNTGVSSWPLRRLVAAADGSGATRWKVTLDTPLSAFTTGYTLRNENGWSPAGRILRLSGAEVEFTWSSCSSYYYCTPDLDAATGWVGARFVVTRDSYGSGGVLGTASFSASALPADQLTGRLLALPGKTELAPVRILAASGSTAVVEGPAASLKAFAQSAGGAVAAISRTVYTGYYGSSDIPTSYPGDVFALRIEDSAAPFVAGELAGKRIIVGGSVVGTVTANSTNVLEGTLVLEGVQRVATGTRLSFATPGSDCDGVRISGSLGVTLDADAGHEGLVVGNTAVAQIESVSGETFTARVCASQLGTLSAAVGKRAALARTGKIRLTLEAAGAFAGVAAGSRVVAYPSGAELTTPPVEVVSPDRVRFEVPIGEDWTAWTALAAGTPFVVADAQGRVGVSVTLDRAVPGYESGGDLLLLTAQPVVVRVQSSSDTQFTFRTPSAVANQLAVGTGLAMTGGGIVHLQDAAATFPAGLRGRTVMVGSQRAVILSNTDTRLTAWLGTLPAEGTFAYVLEGITPTGGLAATEDGRAFVMTASGVVYELGDAGVLSHRGVVGTTRYAVTRTPPAASSTGAISATSDYSERVLTDATASWTPNEWAGSTVELDLATGPLRLQVRSNTATTLQLSNAPPLGAVSYRLEAWSLDVTGGGLTPGALAGRTLYLDGVRHLVRSNTADRIRLVPPSGGLLPGLVAPGSGEAYTFAELPDGASTRLAVTSSGELLAAGWSGLSRATGDGWVPVNERETATPVATGTLLSIRSSTAEVAGASWRPGEHAGKWLLTPTGPFAIWDSGTNTLRLSEDYYSQRNPVAGEPFAIVTPNAPRSVRDLATTGDDVHVAASSAVFRRLAGAWSSHTPSSTESRPGAWDGLPCGDLRAIHAAGPSSVWVGSSSCGASHWDGTTYRRLTRASSESAPDAFDGLPSDAIFDFATDTDGTWFATDAGTARRTASGWTQYGPAQGFPVAGSVVTAGDRVFLGTGDGLLEPLP